jgi:hypothetical protein
MKFPVICRGRIGSKMCYIAFYSSLKIYANGLVNKSRPRIPLWKIRVWFVFKTGFVRINPGVQFPVKCARQHIIGITHSAQYEQLICTITYIILILFMVFCIYST